MHIVGMSFGLKAITFDPLRMEAVSIEQVNHIGRDDAGDGIE
jgi:hypothetical protein